MSFAVAISCSPPGLFNHLKSEENERLELLFFSRSIAVIQMKGHDITGNIRADIS